MRSGSGRAMSVAPQVVRRAESAARELATVAGRGSSVGGELQREQVETDTVPHRSMAELGEELVAWRAHAEHAARREGARVAALGTSPLPVEPLPGETERYRLIIDQFGQLGTEQLVCGCHVHVSVESDEEGVAVLDRIRVWLPVLLALSANSPYWQGRDSGYASYRSQVMGRWPTAGPEDVFGSAEAYHRYVADAVATGVAVDEGMVYLDARLSASYPTVEIRVADVCQDPRDAVLHAALCRALVDTAATRWRAGDPAPDVPTRMLRLATWQAGRYGTSGELLDPTTSLPRPAAEVMEALVAFVRPALEANDDLALVTEGIARLRRVGTGADRQRRELERTGDLTDVVAAAVRATHELEGEGP